MMNQQRPEKQSEEDALLSKKPLGGMSCASCEKNLINMSGTKVEYNSWGKLPVWDPSDRLTRVGQGFSKILNKVKPDTNASKRLKIQTNLSKGNQLLLSDIIKEEGLVDPEVQARMQKTLSPRFPMNANWDMALPEIN